MTRTSARPQREHGLGEHPVGQPVLGHVPGHRYDVLVAGEVPGVSEVADQDAGALVRERLGDGPADSIGSAGHHGDAPIEPRLRHGFSFATAHYPGILSIVD